MRPRFGFLTRSLAVVFILAGLGAAYTGLSGGHQTTPGHAYDDAILFLLAIGFLVVGAGLGLEYLWAWWSGAVITCLTVVMDLVLRSPDRGWGPWLAFLVVFAVTGVQGWRDRSPAEHRDEHAARGSGLTLSDTGATLQKRNDQPE